MAKGDRPLFKVTFRSKDADKGTKGRELCAIWKSRFPNQHNLNFPPGTQIRLPDGSVIKADDCWFSVWVNEPRKSDDHWGEAGSSSAPAAVDWEQEKLKGGFTQEPEEKKDDDLPF